MGALALLPVFSTAVGLLLVTRELELHRRVATLALALPLPIAFVLFGESTQPQLLLAQTIGATVLALAIASDLRERMVDLRPLIGGLLLVIAIAGLGDQRVDVDKLLFVAGSALLPASIAAALWLFGRLYSRLRKIGIDPQTGERAEVYGSGDIPAWALLGATLGSPPLALTAFFAGTIVSALIAVLMLLRSGVVQISDQDGTAPDAAFFPLLPSIVIGGTIALVLQ